MLKVYCPYSALDLGWGTLKNLQNITFENPWYLNRTIMTQEEIIKFLKNNMRLSWEHRNGEYYIVLKVASEKITELNFGEGY